MPVTTEAKTPAPSSGPKGLEGVVAGTTHLSKVFGGEGRLEYCGYAVEPLAEESTFEECVYLLWTTRLPNAAELAAFKAELDAESQVPAELWDVLRPLAKRLSLMDLLRTGISALAAWDDDVAGTRDATDPAERSAANLRIAKRLQARIGTLVAGAWRLQQGRDPLAPQGGQSLAGEFLSMLDGQTPGEYEERIFDAALTLHADHGFNASTFAARVTAATESDIYAAVTSAVGTLAGRLHGGANMRVMKMLEQIGDPAKADAYVGDLLAQPKGRVMGFGHRVYKVEDPRATVLRRMSRELTSRTGNAKWFEISENVEKAVRSRKEIFPNVDFYSASVYGSLNLDPELFTPIFAISRASGWLAHVMEQHADNRLIRPRADYQGESGRHFVSLNDR